MTTSEAFMKLTKKVAEAIDEDTNADDLIDACFALVGVATAEKHGIDIGAAGKVASGAKAAFAAGLEALIRQRAACGVTVYPQPAEGNN